MIANDDFPEIRISQYGYIHILLENLKEHKFFQLNIKLSVTMTSLITILRPIQQAAANLRKKVKILKNNFENCSVRQDIHFGTLKKFLIFEAAYTRGRLAGEDLGYFVSLLLFDMKSLKSVNSATSFLIYVFNQHFFYQTNRGLD